MKKYNKKKYHLPPEQHKNNGVWTNRILVATPTTGLVRMEWVNARYGQIIPCNWSQVDMLQWVTSHTPIQYLLPDAENIIAKAVVEGDYEWLLSIEDDNVLPQDAFLRLNEYMKERKVPIVSGLYFTKSFPADPLVYRGRGNSSFRDFKIGDKVWADGIPFGCTLIHGSIIKALWDESPEYTVNGIKTRRVFKTPDTNFNLDAFGSVTTRGTTDLEFCTRVMKEGIFEKAGWPEYQKKKYPFLCDTNILVGHIDKQGRIYPLGGIPPQYVKDKKTKNGGKK